jgi:hypothetical protein
VATEKWEKGIKDAAKFSNVPVAFNNNSSSSNTKNNNKVLHQHWPAAQPRKAHGGIF